jgi:Kef-type K+ transport system membrane component KefB
LELQALPPKVMWPFVLLLAWFAGEIARRYLQAPRISSYAIVGLAVGWIAPQWLTGTTREVLMVLANIGLGLILFECGYRINLRWLLTHRRLALTGVVEAALTFLAVYFAARALGVTHNAAAFCASLAMATSPASVVRIINEQASSGQVTERILHLAALNTLFAIFAFKVVLGVTLYESSGDLAQAAAGSVLAVCGSLFIGVTLGLVVPGLLRWVAPNAESATAAYAFAVISAVLLAAVLQLSPIIAAMTFGMIARHRRVFLNPSQRGFGSLGDLLAVLLFVVVAAQVNWEDALAGALIGALLIVVRLAVKMSVIGAMTVWDGLPLRKGLLIGLATTPLSALAALMLEQAHRHGLPLEVGLAPIAFMILVLEIIGPACVQFALRRARESRSPEDLQNGT